MTHLANDFQHYFTRRYITLGERYLRSGQAAGEYVGSNSFVTSVGRYRVELEWETHGVDQVLANCSCHQFALNKACPHVWASLRLLDSQSADRPPLGSQESVGDAHPLAWKSRVRDLMAPREVDDHPLLGRTRRQSQVWYLINVTSTIEDEELRIEFHHAVYKGDGTWGKIKKLNIQRVEIPTLFDPRDRAILEMLIPRTSSDRPFEDRPWAEPRARYDCTVSPSIQEVVLPRMAATGRLAWLLETSLPIEEARALSWDDGPTVQLQVRVTEDDTAQQWTLQGELVRGDATAPLDDTVLVLSGGFIVFPDVMARLDVRCVAWVTAFQRNPLIQVPYADRDALLERLHGVPNAPTVLWPDNLQVDVTRTAPQGRLVIKEPQHGFGKPLLLADVTFDYAGTQFAFSDGQQGHFDAAKIVPSAGIDRRSDNCSTVYKH